ncbi:porin [Oleiagrimonas sp. C23AA]|uniref:porin n=1 Tax=Oleiagrimonas sp. C23AA TaxID=2719047 RepID=UPI001F0FCC6F|nr:porin [Oleiagrimonas sp. C23AA]
MRCKLLAVALIAACGGMGVNAAHAAAGDTTIGGKMYFDFTNINQKDNGAKTDASGTGIDVKRFYLSISHQFDDIWSANLTTDFNYVGNDGETNLFVKKAYVQGDFSKAARLRIGSADMPWIPFVEGYYGFRYVENTLTDRLHMANSADWGLHLSGKVGGGVDYAVSAVNGGGYKHPGRSKGVDFEGRVGFAPMDGMIVAVGGYSGKRGDDLQTSSADNTASRGDALIAYASKSFRLGGEYFTAKNWGNVTTPYQDKSDGYSVWGSVAVAPRVNLFARYDHANLSKDIDPKAKDTYYNAGVEFDVTKGFLLSVAWKHEKQEGNPNLGVPVSVPFGWHANRKTDEIGVWGQVAF